MAQLVLKYSEIFKPSEMRRKLIAFATTINVPTDEVEMTEES